MNPNETIRKVSLVVYESGKRLALFCWSMRRHVVWVIGCIVVVLVVVNLWNWYDRHRTKTIDLVVGPAGGSAWETSRKIADQLTRDPSWFGTKYEVRTIETNGYEDNRHRIHQDSTGTVIGFAHDGFGDKENIRILLPLEWNQLHILCRSEFLKTKAAETGLADHPTFSQLSPALANANVYMGPTDSGTRELAEIVVSRHNSKPHWRATHGIQDWNDMRSALLLGTIDVAFYSGPPNAPIVKQIAGDNTCQLVGLDGEHNAIVQANQHLIAAQFEANSYTVDAQFCPKPLSTIASRRILACSKQLSESDAYAVAAATSEAQLYDVAMQWRWNKPTSEGIGGFAYTPHPGAKLLLEGKQPVPWYLWTSTIGGILALVVVGELADVVRRRWLADAAVATPVEEVDAKKPDTTPMTEYESLKRDLDAKIHEAERAPIPLASAELKNLASGWESLRSRVIDAEKATKIDLTEAESLLRGLRELRVELEFHKRPARSSS